MGKTFFLLTHTLVICRSSHLPYLQALYPSHIPIFAGSIFMIASNYGWPLKTT